MQFILPSKYVNDDDDMQDDRERSLLFSLFSSTTMNCSSLPADEEVTEECRVKLDESLRYLSLACDEEENRSPSEPSAQSKCIR